MKKIILVAIAVFAFSFAKAQQNVVKVNPLATLGGLDLVSYERAIGDQTSVVISGAMGGFKVGTTKYSSFGVGVQYRYYFDEALNGFYGAGVAGFKSGKTTFDTTLGGSSSDDINYTNMLFGAKIGKQWLMDSGFTIDLNIGANYRSFKYDSSDSTLTSGLKGNGVIPSFGVGFGYAW